MFYFSKNSINSMNGIDAILVAVMFEAIKTSPYDFGIPSTGGKRSTKLQQSLFEVGRRGIEGESIVTNCDGIIKKSDHQLGKAVDFFGFVDGKTNYSVAVMTAIAEHIIKVAKEKFGLTLLWGGNWKRPDMPHLYYNEF